MKKSLSTLLLGALSMLVLSVPAQAQVAQKRALPGKLLTQNRLIPRHTHHQQDENMAALNAVKEANVSQRTADGQVGTFRMLTTPGKSTGLRVNPLVAGQLSGPQRAPFMAGTPETRNENGIITAPAEGTTKLYSRAGNAYYPQNNQVQIGTQSGKTIVVETEDGTVYVQNLVSRYNNDVWVKGTKSGNTITIPAGQPIAYNAQYGITLSISWATYGANGFAKEANTPIVFSIDGDKLVLQGSDSYNRFIGVFYDVYDSFVGYGDSETVLTLDADYTPASKTLVSAPAGLETEQWFAAGTIYDGSAEEQYNTKVSVGFQGNDVYVQGLVDLFPNAWLKGTLKGSTVTFDARQYVGNYSGVYDMWVAGGDQDGNLTDFTFTYDAASQTLIADDAIYVNAADYQIYYVYYFETLALLKNDPKSPISELPYTNGFESLTDQLAFTIVNANDDDATWTVGDGLAWYSYSTTVNADDYLVSPAVLLQAGRQYRIALDVSAYSSRYPERIELVLGKEPTAEALKQQLVAPTVVDWTLDRTLENNSVTVSETGYYHVGIHAISDADQYRLVVDNLVIESAQTENSIVAPLIDVKADPNGAAKTLVTVTAPSQTLGGSALSVVPKLSIYRDGKVAKTYTNLAAGETKVYVDQAAAGAHTYRALAFDAEGNNGQMSADNALFVGVDVPAIPTGVTAISRPNGIFVSWTPVTQGQQGGTVGTEPVSYNIYEATVEVEYLYGIFPIETVTLGDQVAATTASSVTLGYDTESGQQRYDQAFAITASNASGEGEYELFYPCFGAPFQLPVEDHFAGGLAYAWGAEYSDYVNAALGTESSDGDGSSVMVYSNYEGEFYTLNLGKLAVTGQNPTLLLDVKSLNNRPNTVRVQVEDLYGQLTTLLSNQPGREFHTIKVPLTGYVDDPYVKLNVRVDFNKADTIFLDNAYVIDLLDHNLVAGISAPASVRGGGKAEVTVSVKNLGEKAAEGYTVKLYAGDELLLEQKADAALAQFETATYSVTYAPSVFDKAGNVTLRAEVDYDLDQAAADNVATATIAVQQSGAAQPENVKVQKTADGLTITWNAPSNAVSQYTETFEDTSVFPLWSLGGITESQRYGAFGDWTLYDGDGKNVYGWDTSGGGSVSYENANSPHAWQVFAPQTAGFDASFAPHSGNQILLSICPNTVSNDWLISPELPGVAQTISFYASTLTDQYGPETFEVLYSTTGKNITDFKLLKAESTTATEYQQMSYNLPEGTKYFAIRHTSNDVFGFYIDDVTFTKAGGSVVAYNIYVDGFDDVYDTVTGTTATVKNAPNAKWVAVSAVYADDTESQPVRVDISNGNQAQTGIELVGDSQRAADVYSLDGRLVRRQASDLNGLKGIFVVEGRKVVIK